MLFLISEAEECPGIFGCVHKTNNNDKLTKYHITWRIKAFSGLRPLDQFGNSTLETQWNKCLKIMQFTEIEIYTKYKQKITSQNIEIVNN